MDIFILFQFDHYYPDGGLEDIKGVFPSLQDAKDAFLLNPQGELAEVVQIVNGQAVRVASGRINYVDGLKTPSW